MSKNLIAILLYDFFILSLFVILAIIFKHWWIMFFNGLFIATCKYGNDEDEPQADKDEIDNPIKEKI